MLHGSVVASGDTVGTGRGARRAAAHHRSAAEVTRWACRDSNWTKSDGFAKYDFPHEEVRASKPDRPEQIDIPGVI